MCGRRKSRLCAFDMNATASESRIESTLNRKNTELTPSTHTVSFACCVVQSTLLATSGKEPGAPGEGRRAEASRKSQCKTRSTCLCVSFHFGTRIPVDRNYSCYRAHKMDLLAFFGSYELCYSAQFTYTSTRRVYKQHIITTI